MRLVRLLLLPLSFVMALAGAWHLWGHRVLPMLLARAGLHDASLARISLTTDSLHIAQFAATLVLDAGPVRIDLDDVLCRYRFSDLLRGAVTSLSMGTAEITLPAAPATKPRNALPDIAGALKRVAETRLPLEQLQIHRLLVVPTGAEGHHYPPLVVNMTAAATEKNLSLGLADTPPDTPAPLTARVTLDHHQLNGNLTAEAVVFKAFVAGIGAGSLPSRGRLTARFRFDWQRPEAQALDLLLGLSDLQQERFLAKTIQLQVDGTWAPARQVLQLAPSSQFVVNSARRDDLAVAAVQANLAGQIGLQPGGWQVQIEPASPWTVEGLVVQALPLSPLRLNVVQATVEQAADDAIKANCRFHSPQGAGILQADLEYRPGSAGRGTATLKTVGPLVLSASSNPLLLLPAAKNRPFTLTGGAVGLDLRFGWSKQGKADVRGSLSLDKGEAMMGNTPLTGIAFRQRLRLLPVVESMEPGTVEIGRLGGPVALEHLHLTTAVHRSDSGPLPSLVLARAGGELFGGRITAEHCVYDLNQSVHSCRLEIADVDLAKIVALHNTKGLEATGTVAGQLPLKLSREGISIDEGELHSINQGGIIRYQPPGGASAGSGLSAYALKALEEFRYEQFSARIGYQPEGTLIARLRLEGKSPRLETDRPVHLNINTEQNLLSLLKSIRYSQGVSPELEQEVRQHIPPSHPD
jgi:hypothetical protein